jgi:small conductance mechanosensitive channel
MKEKASLLQALRDFHQINLVQVALIILVAWLLIRLVEWGASWLSKRVSGHLRFYILPSVPVLRLLILVLAIAAIIPFIIKPSFENLVAILGASALALGFALKDYVSSIMGGIVAIYERPCRPGDWVEIEGTYGEIKSIGLRSLSLVTPDDTTVTIPNLKIWQSSIHNANDGRRDLMCVADFYAHPVHDGALVRQALHDVALTSPYLNLERPVTVIVQEKPWGTHYKVKAYPVEGRDQFQFISDLTVRGKAALSDLQVRPALIPLYPEGSPWPGQP